MHAQSTTWIIAGLTALTNNKNKRKIMQGKIIVEEHFAIEDSLGSSASFKIPGWEALSAGLVDIQEKRIEEMDRCGVEKMILSLNAPVIQAIPDADAALDLAKRANDHLAQQISLKPTRFAGLGALPMQDPDAAARELERCVQELGLVGGLVNGFSQVGDTQTVAYYDEAQYRPFWQTVSALDTVFYLHPRGPLESQAQSYRDHKWFAASAWGFAAETSIHALRIMACGLFDELPDLKFCIGHMGEHIPYDIWRIDHRIRKSPHGIPAKNPLADYLRKNVWISTSGDFNTRALTCATDAMGADRIMFAVDYPFEIMSDGTDWFDALELPDGDQAKIGRDNAIKLFGLETNS